MSLICVIEPHICPLPAYHVNLVVHICNLHSTISVHVAQWLEHLTVYQKVTGCTHMQPSLYHLSPRSQWLEYLTIYQKVTGCTHMQPSFYHLSPRSQWLEHLTVYQKVTGCTHM